MATSSRPKLRDRTPDNDIAYGGILSYRHLRLIGWVCMWFAQIAVIISINIKVNPASEAGLSGLLTFFKFFAPMPVILFMLANFANINFKKNKGWRHLFMTYGILAGGLYILANLLSFHYGFEFLMAFGHGHNFWSLTMDYGAILANSGQMAYTLNVFIDLFLLCLLFFFADYTPKKGPFSGKKVVFFRLGVLFPILYEVAAIVLKYFMGIGDFYVPSFAFFLLPSKPPFVFFAFVAVALALNISKRRYIVKFGHTTAEWDAYSSTKAHTLKVSIMIAVIFLLTAIVDVIALFSVAIGVAIANISATEAAFNAELDKCVRGLFSAGFGGAITLVVIIPLVLLFSYKKTHKNPKIDIAIPVVAIAVIAFIYIEGVFQVLTRNVGPVVEKLKQWLLDTFGSGEEIAEESAESSSLASSVSSLLDTIRFR